MGLGRRDLHRGGGRHCHGGETYRLSFRSLQAPAQSDPSLRMEIQEKRNQLGARTLAQHSPGHQPHCPRRFISSHPGWALRLPLGLPVPAHLSKTARETAASSPVLTEAVARQAANSCPHLEQLVSPSLSTPVACNSV